MKGVVEVIQHKSEGGSEVVYRDDNMIVDGAKKTIVNMLTHIPTPSGAAEIIKTPDQNVFYLGPNIVAQQNINNAFFDSSSITSSTVWNSLPLDSNGNIISDVFWAPDGVNKANFEWSATESLQLSSAAAVASWKSAQLELGESSCPSGSFYYVQCDLKKGSGVASDKRALFNQITVDGYVSGMELTTLTDSRWDTDEWFTVSGIYDFRVPESGKVQHMLFNFWLYDGANGDTQSSIFVDNVIVRRMNTDKPPGVDEIGDYQIKAMTLGSAKQNFNAHESRYGAQNVYTDASSQYLYMSGLSSTIFALAPPVPNRVLEETGNKGNTVGNGQLEYTSVVSDDLVFREPSQIEGSPEIKSSYINSDGERVPALYVNKKLGQDYAVIESRIHSPLDRPISLVFKGEATLPFEISLVKKSFPMGVPFAEVPETTEYYNFETETFTQWESTKEVKFTSRGDSRVNYSPIVERLPKDLEQLNTEFFLRVVVPRRNLYEKGFIAIEKVAVEDTSKYSLANPTFASVDNFLTNSNFRNYIYSPHVPDYLSSSLGLVDFAYWEEENPIENSQNVIDEMSSLGSLTLYEDITGDTGVTLQASCLDTLDPSGAAGISQRFGVPSRAQNWFVNLDTNPFINANGMHSPHLALSMDVYTASSDAKGIIVSLENETAETHYSFQDIVASGITGNVWGTNSPLVISEAEGNAVSGQFVSISHIINIPPTYMNDSFRLRIQALGCNDGSLAKYSVKNVRLGAIENWSYAHQGTFNSASNKSTLVLPAQGMGSGIIFSAVGKVTNSQAENGRSLAGLTYIGQTFSNIDPKKKYNLIIDAEKMSPSGTASLGISLAHSDYADGQSTNGDVMKLAGLQNISETLSEGRNMGILYSGYTKFLNSTTATRKVSSFRGLTVNDPDYHNRYDRAVHFMSPEGTNQDLYVPVSQNSKYDISVDSARRNVSGQGYWDELENQNINDLRNVYCSVHLQGGNAEFTYNFATHTWEEINGILESNYTDFSFLLNDVEKGLSPQVTEPTVYTPDAGATSPYNTNQDGTLNVVLKFFYMVDEVGGFKAPQYDSNNLGYQQLYIRDFSMRGNYPVVWSPEAHFNYAPTVPAEERQGRSFFYDWDGTWTKLGTAVADLFPVGAHGALSGAVVEGIPSIDWSLSGNNQICIPVYGMDVLMGNTGGFGLSYDASAGATKNSTYSLFLMHNEGCSIQVNSVSLVDVSLGAYGGPVPSNETQITTSENTGASIVPENLVGGWHSHFVSSIEGAPVPKVYVRDLSGYQFLGVSGSPSVPYQAPTIAYSQYVSELGLTNENISISVDQMGVTDALFKCVQLYNSKTKQRQIWNMNSQSWIRDNSNYPFSLSKYRNSTKPFRVPNEDRKTYYPAIDWTTSGLTIPKWKSLEPDPRILTVMFRQGGADTGQYYLRNLRFYSNYTNAEVSSVYPEFPAPEDTAIQPESLGTPGKLGHFLNNIEFYTSGNTFTGDKTFEEALSNGCYPPAEGILYFSGAGGAVSDTPTRLYGNLNRFSVITPNGYILEQQRMPYGKSTLFDSSCGFVVDPAYNDVYFSSVAHDTDQYGVFYLTDNLFSVSSTDVLGSNGNFEGGYLISGNGYAYDDPNQWAAGAYVGPDSHVFLSSITSGVQANTIEGQDWAYTSRAGDSRWSLILSGDDDGSPANHKGYTYSFNQWTAPSGHHYLAKQDVQFMGGSGLDQHFQIREYSPAGSHGFLELATDTQMEWLENHQPNEFSSVSAVGWYGDAVGAAGSVDGHLQWLNFIYDTAAAPENATSSVAAIDNLSLKRCCGPGDDMAQPRVKYALTLSRDEWELLDKMYGGIEAVGLHTMNLIETAKKRGSERGLAIPPYLTSATEYPFSSTMTYGDLPTQYPMEGGDTAGSREPGSEGINSMCLVAKELPLSKDNQQSAVRLFNTSFGYPALDPLGWASGVGNSMTLSFNYKVVDDPATLGVPKAHIASPHFGKIELKGTKGVWQQFSKTFTVAASGVGENQITWSFAEGQEQALAGTNEIRLTDVKFTNNTHGTVLANYSFSFRSNDAAPNAGYFNNEVSAFNTDWHTPNYMHLNRMYDGASYESSLYNVNQLTLWEPEFDLFAKKVFFPGGLKLGDNSDKLTIIWTLYF